MLEPVLKKYLFYTSPLHTQNGKIIGAAVAVALAAMAIIGWHTLTLNRTFFGIVQWVPFSVVASLIGYFLLSFLDRERRVRAFHIITILAVMVITGPFAAWLNGFTQPPTTFVFVGFVEESMKILPVLLLAIFVPNLIRSKKDGIIYGALAGMGFNIVEFGAYIYTLSHGELTLMEALIQQSTRFGIWGFGSHIIWSAFAGLGIGYAMESHYKGFKKWRRFIAYYLLVAVAHSAYDLGALALAMLPITIISSMIRGVDYNSIDAELAKTQFGPVRDGMKYMHYLYNVLFLIVLFIQGKRSFAWENDVQKNQLSSESKDVISENELKLLNKEKYFTKRKYKKYSKDIGSAIVFYQNLLAMQKEVMSREGVTKEGQRIADLLRAEIKTLRAY